MVEEVKSVKKAVKKKPAVKKSAKKKQPRKSTARPKSEHKKVGVKPKLTEEIIAKFVSVLVAGTYQEVAIRYVGVSKSSYYEWLDMGRSEVERMENEGLDEPTPELAMYVNFFKQIEEARAGVEVRGAAEILKAGAGDWRAMAWFMSRSFPKRWGDRLIHMGDAEDPIAIHVDVSDIEKAVKEVMEARKGVQ